MRDSFIFYRSFWEAIKELDDKTQLEIFRNIATFSLDEKTEDLQGITKAMFTLIQPQLEANNKRFKNGSTPKQKQVESKPEANQKQTVSKSEANKNDNVNANVNVNGIKEKNTKKKCIFLDDIHENYHPMINEFISFRKEIKKPFVQSSLNKFFIELQKLSSGDIETAQAIIDQSIANGWRGIFALKEEYHGNGIDNTQNNTGRLHAKGNGRGNPPSTVEAFARACAEHVSERQDREQGLRD